jgi:hypothetical protein
MATVPCDGSAASTGVGTSEGVQLIALDGSAASTGVGTSEGMITHHACDGSAASTGVGTTQAYALQPCDGSAASTGVGTSEGVQLIALDGSAASTGVGSVFVAPEMPQPPAPWQPPVTRFTVALFQPVTAPGVSGARVLTINPRRVSGLQFSTAINAGFKDCSFRYGCDLTESFDWYLGRLNHEVRVYHGDEIAWEGRLSSAEIAMNGLNIVARGYARNCYDVPYDGPNTDIATILAASCLQISTDYSRIGAPGVDWSGITWGDNLYPGDAFDKMALAGSATSPWYWYIWEGKIFWFEAKPTTISWNCSIRDLAPDGLNLGRDLEEVWNHEGATYAVADNRSTTAFADNLSSQTKYALIRSRVLNMGNVDATIAAAARDADLVERGDGPQNSSFRLNGYVYGGAAGNMGVRTPLWPLRAGKIMQIADMVPSGTMIDTPSVDALRTFLIAETNYEVDANMMTVQPDRAEKTMDHILQLASGYTGDQVQKLAAYFTRST